jgi:hypothetical protein
MSISHTPDVVNLKNKISLSAEALVIQLENFPLFNDFRHLLSQITSPHSVSRA